MPHPKQAIHSAIRTSTHRSPLTAAELITQVERALQTNPTLNHCFSVTHSREKISIQHLNQSGEILLKHNTGVSFNFISIEYRSADFTFVRKLKQELSTPLQLSSPIKGGIGEPRMFESLGKFIQFIPKFFLHDFIITESAIESARLCEFDGFEDIVPQLESFRKIRETISGKSSYPEVTPQQIQDYQCIHQDKRLILHEGVKFYLSRYLKIPSQHGQEELRIYFRWEPKLKRHLIGWVEIVNQA